MKTREIPRTEWTDFFHTYSREHQGSPVTLEIFGPEIGDQIEERELALEGVNAELSDAGDKIEFMIGAKSDGHVTHTIVGPNQVSCEQTDEGTDVVLAIKAKEGTMTLLRFPAIRPTSSKAAA